MVDGLRVLDVQNPPDDGYLREAVKDQLSWSRRRRMAFVTGCLGQAGHSPAIREADARRMPMRARELL